MRIKALWLLIFLTACSPAVAPTATIGHLSPTPVQKTNSDLMATDKPGTQSETSPASTNARVGEDERYVIPPALIPFDGIAPVYEPQFVSAQDSPLLADELVMGVSIDGESKAYPVTVLRFREMVDDEIAGWPILVTW